MHMYTHTHMHMYTHTHMHTLNTHMHMYTMHSRVCTHTHTHTHTESSDLSSEPGPTDKDKPTTQHRLFVSVCWELNPHLLLLSAVSGQFNPHISWLLERLGFKDAQTTIPKWIQRGAMDPLDMVVASLVELLVTLSAKKKLQLRAASPVSD